MPDTAQQPRNRTVLAVAAAVVVVALAVVLAVWLTRDSGDDDGSVAVPSAQPPSATSTPGDGVTAQAQGDVLPSPMSGQDAVDALGDQLERVAELNGMSADELRDLLLRDASVQVTPSGRLMYDDRMTPPPTSQ
ncbi:hypothetical protein [Jiangella alba]|uniref:Uncharacterized protein n=1 Tax=Jiangella alba TaxID=561176 RepID=A0A1H5PRP2_9ACTN|nr:hypothetical protein [Jiangella alba]SEF16399.1 hypothetical protein SAMN04488561_5368 [Jiangella alba]